MDAGGLKQRIADRTIRRICVIKPSALGDVVQSLPVLPILRERFPVAHIAWVINRELSGLVAGHRCLDEVIPFDRRGGVTAWWSLLRHLRHSQFDLVFDLQGLFRTGVMALATGAPIRIGLQTAREGSHLACHTLLPDSGVQVPAHRRAWRIAEELGLEDLRPRSEIDIPASDLEWANEVSTSLRGPLLIVQPGTRWQTKHWPIRHFAEVVRRAIKEFGVSVIVIGSRSEVKDAQELVEMVRQVLPRGDIRSLAGQTSIKQLAALLQQADLMLSNDSGPLHLAAALGTPVVGVYTCTSPIRSGPPGTQHVLVSTQLPCAASYCKTCPQQGSAHLACFEELAPDRVWQGVMQAWSRIEQTQRRAA